MIYDSRKQSMASMETDYSKHTLSMEDKMAAGAFGRARNYGWAGHKKKKCSYVALSLYIIRNSFYLFIYSFNSREARLRLDQ